MQATPGAPLNAGDTHAADDGRVSAPRRIRLFVSVALIVYALDVGSKIVAVDQLGDRPPVELLGGLLTLRLTTNAGAAFSIGTDLTFFLSLIAVAVVLGVVWVARRVGSPLWALSLGLLLGGAAGNLTDRLLRDPAPLRGHVVDFLELPYWPIFNVADSAIVVAAVLIVLQSLRGVAVDGTRAER